MRRVAQRPRSRPGRAAAAAYDLGMTRLVTASLVVVGALALAAPALAASTSDWSTSADKICARTNAAIDKIPEPDSTKTLISGTEKILELGKRQTGDLAKLKRPSGDAATIAKLVGVYEQQVGIVKSLIAVLKHDDQAKVKTLLAKGNDLESKAKSLARKLGAKKCAE